jgi:hypothetical protein
LLPPAAPVAATLPLQLGGQVISAWLCMSPCRSDYIFTNTFAVSSQNQRNGVRHIVSEDSGAKHRSFLLIVRTGWIFTARLLGRVPPDTRSFQHIAEFIDSAESTVSRRSKPSSRTALMGEQPNPWDLLQPQDATSRHRGAKPCRRCGLLGKISLLSPGYLLSVDRLRFHMP